MNSLGMLCTKRPIFEVFKIILDCCYSWDIFKLVALILKASKLLAMVKDSNGFALLLWSRCFFDLVIIPLFDNFKSHFRNTYPPTSLEFWPLEAMNPSFLASKSSSTYTLIKPWCKSTLKTFLITFFELLFLKNCVMPRGLWWTLSPLLNCFMVFILFFTINMGNMWKGSLLLSMIFFS
jgi:hypothetical protein